MAELKIFSGNAHPKLAARVVEQLQMELGAAEVGRFSDGEISVHLQENVRGKDVFIIQPTCAPTNDNLLELIVMADCFRRASAARVTAVIPYFGYARQDRRVRSARVPITAKVVADMLSSAGFNRILTIDLHADQIQGFFSIPVDNIYASPVMLADMERQCHPQLMVVSPDVGGVVRARAMAKLLHDADLAIIDKRRPEANAAEVMHIIGDVKGRTCILVDDIVDTAGTLCAAADALKREGAKKVLAYCTHPVLSGKALATLGASALDELVVTDTIPLADGAQGSKKIRQLSVAETLAESIRRISNEESLSALFARREQEPLF